MSGHKKVCNQTRDTQPVVSGLDDEEEGGVGVAGGTDTIQLIAQDGPKVLVSRKAACKVSIVMREILRDDPGVQEIDFTAKMHTSTTQYNGCEKGTTLSHLAAYMQLHINDPTEWLDRKQVDRKTPSWDFKQPFAPQLLKSEIHTQKDIDLIQSLDYPSLNALCLAADYINCPTLLELCTARMVYDASSRTVAEIASLFLPSSSSSGDALTPAKEKQYALQTPIDILEH